MKTSNIERRNITHEFRVSGDGEPASIAGYASLFNSPYDAGWWIEQIDPHAFDSVMGRNPDVRALWNHNADHVLGRTTAGTLHLSIDARGLAYSVDPPDTQLARDLMVSMRRKDVTQSSFAFITKRDQWVDNPDGTLTRTILEFEDLLDVSPVTYPANPATSASSRSIPASMPKEMRARLETRGFMDADCVCGCPQCASGACDICSSTPQCISAMRSLVNDSEVRKMHMRIALLNK
jgi:HK97 family phage prohead protease